MWIEGRPLDHQSRSQVLTLHSTSAALTQSRHLSPGGTGLLLPLLLAYTWTSQGSQGNLEKREVSTRPFSAANHPVTSHHTWDQIQSPSARFQAPVAWPRPPQVISRYAAHRPPRPPTQTLCCSWHMPRSFLLSGLCPGSSPARSTLPHASPGWLHLVIQVCCKPLRVPPNSLFCLLSCSHNLGFVQGQWLSLLHPWGYIWTCLTQSW